MKKIITAIITTAFLFPMVSSASTLTQSQVNAIIAMIRPLESPQDYEMAYLRLRVGIVPIQETRLDTLRA